MNRHQDNKALILRYFEEFEAASPDGVRNVLESYTSRDYRFRAVHPFNELDDCEAVAETLWRPLLRSFTAMQRREDVFMAGTSEVDDTDWVTSMGNFMGLFDESWLGIPCSGKIAFLPYVEFHRVEDGEIRETAVFFDILRIMKQVGLSPLPLQTGAEIVHPGPRTHDGLLFDPQDPSESKKSLDLVNRMKDDTLVVSGVPVDDPEALLARDWHPDMIWYGPSGIGSTYTIERYRKQHQGPAQASLDNYVWNGQLCRFAEGHYAGWFGWPNLTMDSKGGFMGLPASGERLNMRVVDIYRRQGDRLAENWVFIDMLYWMYQQNVDVLERMRSILRA